MNKKALLLCLLLLQTVAWGQIPRPTPPGEPVAYGVVQVQVLKEEHPLPGVWVTLQPVAANGLPNGKDLVRWTDGKGEASLPLLQPLRSLLLILRDAGGGFCLQIPLEQALGTWTLGPYRLEVRVALP